MWCAPKFAVFVLSDTGGQRQVFQRCGDGFTPDPGNPETGINLRIEQAGRKDRVLALVICAALNDQPFIDVKSALIVGLVAATIIASIEARAGNRPFEIKGLQGDRVAEAAVHEVEIETGAACALSAVVGGRWIVTRQKSAETLIVELGLCVDIKRRSEDGENFGERMFGICIERDVLVAVALGAGGCGRDAVGAEARGVDGEFRLLAASSETVGTPKRAMRTTFTVKDVGDAGLDVVQC